MVKLVQCVRRRPHLAVDEFRAAWEAYGGRLREAAAELGAVSVTLSTTLETPLNDALRESRGSATPFDGIAGFHLNEVYSSWVRLEAMVRTFLSAKDHGDEAMKTFVNTSLGETWVETGEAPDWQRLYDRRESWPAGTVPMGGLFLTAGADVQKDRIEVDVWAWGRGLESWVQALQAAGPFGKPGEAVAWLKAQGLGHVTAQVVVRQMRPARAAPTVELHPLPHRRRNRRASSTPPQPAEPAWPCAEAAC